MNNLIFGGVIVFAIIVISIVAFYIPPCQHKAALNGWWVPEQEFLSLSDFTHVSLYIDGKKGYLTVMTGNDRYLVDSEIEISAETYNPSVVNAWLCPDMKPAEFSMCIKGAAPVIPDNVRIRARLSIADGSLMLFSGDDIYLVLYRDNLASSEAKIINSGK